MLDKFRLYLRSIDRYHADWFSRASQLADRLGVEPSIPRRTARQQHRNNVPAENEEEYYKLVVTIPMLGMQARFFLKKFLISLSLDNYIP